MSSFFHISVKPHPTYYLGTAHSVTDCIYSALLTWQVCRGLDKRELISAHKHSKRLTLLLMSIRGVWCLRSGALETDCVHNCEPPLSSFVTLVKLLNPIERFSISAKKENNKIVPVKLMLATLTSKTKWFTCKRIFAHVKY